MTSAIIHRYDNKPDILAVERNGCSEVYRKSRNDTFDLVIVIPTGRAGTQICVVADATSGQYIVDERRPWRGRPDRFPVRVHLRTVRYTTLDRVRKAVEAAGVTWAVQWTVRVVDIDESLLFDR